MYVHSLVRVTQDKRGWRAPVELGDTSPQYVSYVVPFNRAGELSDEYICELVTKSNRQPTLRALKLIKAGTDSFFLEISPQRKIWFHVRPIAKREQRLPYIGRLKHEDFKFRLIEIEPVDIAQLDRLCEEEGLFVVGCDPEKHYSEYPGEQMDQMDDLNQRRITKS